MGTVWGIASWFQNGITGESLDRNLLSKLPHDTFNKYLYDVAERT